MPRIVYETKRFSRDTLDAIDVADQILRDYAAQGYDLTLRQLFYQHVARGLIPNTERSYKRLGSIVNDARMAGLIDWDHIIDRTRAVRSITHWDDPAHIIRATADSFKVDYWAAQSEHVEVWLEKDALVGVVEPACQELDVPLLSCRGYTSQSEMWAAGQRLLEPVEEGKNITILHLGDHDPSGIDMSLDINNRLTVFIGSDYVRSCAARDGVDLTDDAGQYIGDRLTDFQQRFHMRRIALTMAQIRQYNPPPNPAKVTDSRAARYIAQYGHQSWELDSLDPPVLTALVRDNVTALIEPVAWKEAQQREEEGQELLRQASSQWEDIAQQLREETEEDE